MVLHHGGFPIRKSAGQSLFPANRSLSQVIASFFGSWCQGIHLTLLFAWTSCILFLYFGSLWIVWVSLNIFRSGFYWLLFAVKKQFTRLLHFVLSSTFRWTCCTRLRVLFPFRLERLIYLFRLFVLFCSFSTQKTFLLFDCQRSCGSLATPGRSGWTRTIDLALIRRAL